MLNDELKKNPIKKIKQKKTQVNPVNLPKLWHGL
jgi:hypothetical protein